MFPPRRTREAILVSPSLSHAPTRAHPAPAADARPALVEDVLSTTDRIRVAGFCPGLGSRPFYRELARLFLVSGVPEVPHIFREAAPALGFPSRPALLLLD